LEFKFRWMEMVLPSERSERWSIVLDKIFSVKRWQRLSRKDTNSKYMVFRLVPSVPRTGESDIGLSATGWETPQASHVQGRGTVKRRSDGSLLLAGQVETAIWQTPAVGQFSKRRQVGQAERAELLLPGQVKATWPTPNASDGSGGPQHPDKRKAGNHSVQLPDYVPTPGPIPSGCLARMGSFVERLLVISAWLMGYPANYLRHWEKPRVKTKLKRTGAS
jgi:hypothetical protein